MNFSEAIEVLKSGSPDRAIKEEAFEAIKSEIKDSSSVSLSKLVNCSPLSLVLATLATELTGSTSPAFSYRILRALLESIVLGKNEIEDDIALRGLFINKQLGTDTVKDGLWKCMVALGACTKVYGE